MEVSKKCKCHIQPVETRRFAVTCITSKKYSIKKRTDKTRSQNMHIIDTWLVFNERWEIGTYADYIQSVRGGEGGGGKNMAAQIREFCVHTAGG